MTGQLYIDGVDAFVAYAAYIPDGGLTHLVAMPPLKTVKSNDWYEEDGVDADLTAPVLNTKELTLKFAFKGSYLCYLNLLEKLSQGSYHDFNFAFMRREYRLRLVGHSAYEVYERLGFATLKFADDFPLRGYTYSEPASGMTRDDEYKMGSRPLTDYGIRVLKGTLAEMLKTPDVKPNLLRNIGSAPGAVYDGAQVKYKGKDVSFKLLFRADSIEQLWRNYDAFLYDLTRPDERLLSVKSLGQDFYGYYKSCNVSYFNSSSCWLECSIVMTLTRGIVVHASTMRLEGTLQNICFTQNAEILINNK